jgi:hypothetical protein
MLKGKFLMKLNTILSISAVYMALLSLGFMFAPQVAGINAVPVDASPALIAYLRVFGSTFLGIAIMNWLVRNAEPSTALNALILGNIVGFGAAALLDVWGISSGARQLAYLFAAIHFVLAAGFVWARNASARMN